MMSAGVTHTLTRNCTLGGFDNCSCDDTRNGKMGGQNWMWGGCSDNLPFGEAVTRQFMDALEVGQDARAAVNLHNYGTGRAVTRHACKCHGVSGSCTLQTCWLQLADLGEAAAFLKVRYDLAIRLDGLRGTGNSAKAAAGTGSKTHASAALLTLKTEKLVYMEDSPDFCGRNDSLGAAGAAGRECRRPGGNSTSNSCMQLCTTCGLRVTERKIEVTVTCNCTFTWCCKVTCDHCHRYKAAGTTNNTKRFCERLLCFRIKSQML
uniref:Protein Wnt n=1 Tax=Eptatretus burgeri TaxID=7764 RepID=A0A8C4X138_EPTBU